MYVCVLNVHLSIKKTVIQARKLGRGAARSQWKKPRVPQEFLSFVSERIDRSAVFDRSREREYQFFFFAIFSSPNCPGVQLFTCERNFDPINKYFRHYRRRKIKKRSKE